MPAGRKWSIPDMPQPPAVENSQQQAEEPVYQPVQPTESIPPLPEQTIPQQEQTIEVQYFFEFQHISLSHLKY